MTNTGCLAVTVNLYFASTRAHANIKYQISQNWHEGLPNPHDINAAITTKIIITNKNNKTRTFQILAK